MQFRVLLSFGRGGQLSLSQVQRPLAERVPAVPRLRQRLVRASFGCGGPIWVDDPEFDIGDHVRAVSCPEPGDEHALLDTALSVITTPLPRAAPLWSAVLVTGLAGGNCALVLVLRHPALLRRRGRRRGRVRRDPARPPRRPHRHPPSHHHRMRPATPVPSSGPACPAR